MCHLEFLGLFVSSHQRLGISRFKHHHHHVLSCFLRQPQVSFVHSFTPGSLELHVLGLVFYSSHSALYRNLDHACSRALSSHRIRSVHTEPDNAQESLTFFEGMSI